MKQYIYFILIFLIFGLTPISVVHAQYYNKEIKAEILIERSSEFTTFKASAENLTPSDYSLQYEFMVFSSDDNGNTSKSSQANNFFIEGHDKVLLAQANINFNEEGKIILVLLLYDKDGKTIGKDRIVLEDGGRTEIDPKREKIAVNSQDQAKPQDGFIINGLIIENTLTKAGRDFYRYFYSDYYNRGIISAKNITIEEAPGRGRTTRISVKVGDDLVWQFFSQPRKDFLKKMAKTALDRAIAHLQRLQQQNQQITRY
ncbi:CsgE family curli-type amyloid fiber assembly protein [Mesonia ostreae]|uniref:Curli production assembly/transport component CsgE n=1 Tax=Mesonia ostreae TaxID=861110 RepID=A0ABU2KEN9_9FLAO|nr:CsgE family curli-type amyloid fiber assembly protein [Mesonia ostreae]MDT0293154.1 CsgE family curli-type amyloid fiber assembly protein [Mesonia ostreae]